MKRVPGYLWLVWTLAGLLMEGVALGTAESGDTLTEVTIRTLPDVAVLGFALWVAWHFGARIIRDYLNNREVP